MRVDFSERVFRILHASSQLPEGCGLAAQLSLCLHPSGNDPAGIRSLRQALRFIIDIMSTIYLHAYDFTRGWIF